MTSGAHIYIISSLLMELLGENIRNNKAALLGLVVIIAAIFAVVYAIKQPTQVNQNASQIANLNSGGDSIGKTNNSDGTMGPGSYVGNYSSKLSSNQTGTMILTVSDPPSFPTGISTKSATVSSLIIQVKKVEVHLTQIGSKTADHWETLNIPSPMSVDLAMLAKGAVVNLGQTVLAAGKYTELRMYIANPQGQLSDGTKVNFSIPGKYNIIRIVKPFEVSSGQNTTVVVDFNTSDSVNHDSSGYQLKPVVSKFLTTR